MNKLIPLGLLAAGVYWLSSRKEDPKKLPFQTVTASSGRVWNTRFVTAYGDGEQKKTVVQLWAPTGAFNNPTPVLVLTYEQTGSDKKARTLIAFGPEATAPMVEAAATDFSVKKPAK